MGLDNGFIIRDSKGKNSYGDDICYWRKDYAVRDIILSYLDISDENCGGEYPLTITDVDSLIRKFDEIVKYGKEKFDELTDEELPWYMDDELSECYNIENKYEKQAKENEVYKHWAEKVVRQLYELALKAAIEFKYGDRDSQIIFFDSF